MACGPRCVTGHVDKLPQACMWSNEVINVTVINVNAQLKALALLNHDEQCYILD